MASEKYKKLINDICTIANLPVQQQFYVNADLALDGVNFTLVNASIEDFDAIGLYCDFGAPPSQKRVAVLERLLEINLSLHGFNTPLFTLNSESGHILLARVVPIEGLSALELMNLMNDYAVQAREWRENFFLEDAKSFTKASSGASRHPLFRRL